MLEAVCDSILSHLGTDWAVGVAKLVNYEELAARSNLPTTLLLAQRFLAAVGASRDDWVSFGSLSARHVGLVLAPGAAGREWDLASSLDRFSVVDPALAEIRLEMKGVGVVVELTEFRSLTGVFASVNHALNEAEKGTPVSPNDPSHWCPPER